MLLKTKFKRFLGYAKSNVPNGLGVVFNKSSIVFCGYFKVFTKINIYVKLKFY